MESNYEAVAQWVKDALGEIPPRTPPFYRRGLQKMLEGVTIIEKGIEFLDDE